MTMTSTSTMISEKAVLRFLVVALMVLHLGRWDIGGLKSLKTSFVASAKIATGANATSCTALHQYSSMELQEELSRRNPENVLQNNTAKMPDQPQAELNSLPKEKPLQSPPAHETAVQPTAEQQESSQIEIDSITPQPSPQPSPSTSSLPPRLELLHIQKNAGSLLEVMALKANIPWGTCHFDFPWKPTTPFKDCPPLLDTTVTSNGIYWHYPLQHLNQTLPETYKTYPYDNHPNATYVARPKKYFVVVRNPYDRLISLFYYDHRGKKAHIAKGPNAIQNLNAWSQRFLQDGRKAGLYWPNSTLCQHQYLYDESTGQPIPDVDHVVQFEYLKQDFDPLARQYGLPLAIPEHKENAHNYSDPETLTEKNLDVTTLSLINTICKKDFELARGYEMIW